MKNKKKSLFLILLLILMTISEPIYGKAEGRKGDGNISGIEDRLLLMKQDFLYLDNEIQRLKGECE